MGVTSGILPVPIGPVPVLRPSPTAPPTLLIPFIPPIPPYPLGAPAAVIVTSIGFTKGFNRVDGNRRSRPGGDASEGGSILGGRRGEGGAGYPERGARVLANGIGAVAGGPKRVPTGDTRVGGGACSCGIECIARVGLPYGGI